MGRRALATVAAAVLALTLGFVFVPAQAAETEGGAEASKQLISRTLTLQANKKKVKKGKKVTLSGQLSQDPTPGVTPGICIANQPIELARRKPGADDFETFTTVQTNGQGQYSSEVKVKKKTEYFSRAPSNGLCSLATGDNVFVKVKKKKKKAAGPTPSRAERAQWPASGSSVESG